MDCDGGVVSCVESWWAGMELLGLDFATGRTEVGESVGLPELVEPALE